MAEQIAFRGRTVWIVPDEASCFGPRGRCWTHAEVRMLREAGAKPEDAAVVDEVKEMFGGRVVAARRGGKR